jgi:hypothetical protein
MMEASVNHDHADIPHGDVHQLQVTNRPCDLSEASLKLKGNRSWQTSQRRRQERQFHRSNG